MPRALHPRLLKSAQPEITEPELVDIGFAQKQLNRTTSYCTQGNYLSSRPKFRTSCGTSVSTGRRKLDAVCKIAVTAYGYSCSVSVWPWWSWRLAFASRFFRMQIDELTYGLVKALFENLADFRHLHPALSTLDIKHMVPSHAVILDDLFA